MSEHCVALQVYHRGGSKPDIGKLREAMSTARVGDPDDDGIIEVHVEAPDFE